MIVFENVSKSFGARPIIDGLDLTIDEGAFFVLLGPSGCGKTTTLKLVNRLQEPSTGRILVRGEDVTVHDPMLLRRGIGYVIQSGGLFPHWSVADNIATVPRLLGWPEEQIRTRVSALLALLRLDPDSATAYPHALSGGQQQRVGVARALAADPPILLMDEPFGALDPVTRAELQDELKAIHARTGKTILLVTHDVDEALTLATRIALMKDGRLVSAGSPAEVLRAAPDSFARAFLGGHEIGLRRLAVETVAERMRSGTSDGQAIDAAMSLREALALMLSRGVDRLPVQATGDGVASTLWLEDLVRP